MRYWLLILTYIFLTSCTHKTLAKRFKKKRVQHTYNELEIESHITGERNILKANPKLNIIFNKELLPNETSQEYYIRKAVVYAFKDIYSEKFSIKVIHSPKDLLNFQENSYLVFPESRIEIDENYVPEIIEETNNKTNHKDLEQNAKTRRHRYIGISNCKIMTLVFKDKQSIKQPRIFPTPLKITSKYCNSSNHMADNAPWLVNASFEALTKNGGNLVQNRSPKLCIEKNNICYLLRSPKNFTCWIEGRKQKTEFCKDKTRLPGERLRKPMAARPYKE